ncbi:Carboxylesterase, type B [Penicillium italicum]|uniref:Histone-lysine N-methyltransferase SET9 n=1 Tax=Penicillium italicum TaxID=40296 RepID=A0A0A2LB30_PENIT|nr:Carboxylesterase, type B [Penicillium italicum]
MPPKKARKNSPAAERRERLTLAKLASYDDVATDALVDHAYFWTTTRKNRTKYSPARGIHDDDIGRILLHDVIVDKDIATAERNLLEISGLKKYITNLRSPREKEWFRRHLRKYIHMYLPDCPFEVTTTNRYIITQHEAAICARRFIKKGDEIKHLSGTLVSMTHEEELDLGLTRKDFSVVMSSRRKSPSFFLGPARFANHDCDANGSLTTRGNEGMSVVAMRNIHEGEEITVSYGEDYFGVDNCECLCHTCEIAVRNGWSAQVDTEASSKESSPVSEAAPDDSNVSRKRRRSSDVEEPESSSNLRCSTPHKRAKFQRQVSKLREEISVSELAGESGSTRGSDNTPIPDTVLIPTALLAEPVPQASELKKEITELTAVASPTDSPNTLPVATGVPCGNARGDPNGTNGTNSTIPSDCESPTSTADETHRSSTSTTPTTEDDTGTKIKTEEILLEPSQSKALNGEDNPDASPEGQPVTTHPMEIDPEEGLSDLSNSTKLDAGVDKPKKRKPRTKRRFIVDSVETESQVARVPGDYTKTSRLLAQKYDRWVECQTCDTWFLQSNSYLTRRECPRCERHSKLYGYQWPSTDKSPDGEDRVMDHRTIHRFLSPEAQSRICRRDRGVSFGITPTPELSDTNTPETETRDALESSRDARASRRRTRELLTLLLGLGVTASTAWENPQVSLDYGSFKGQYDSTYNLSYFRKIPFAAPPIGENRFRAPQPPLKINGDPYDTNQDFDMCPQRTVNGSEDCLYLGLFSRPWDLAKDSSRPVLVVFYGGAFIQGSAAFTMPPSSFPILNVSNINDYIVIYSNYRVNAFGFLPGKAIKNSPTSDLNPGLLDQQYVLKWVQSHIYHFGGNPRNVTIWGQSAGAGSVVAQVLANGRHGQPKLFSKALASSPFWPKTYKHNAPQAEAIYTQLANLTGCAIYKHADETLACLKSVDVQKIRDASLIIGASHTWTTSSYTWAPVIDGTFLVDTLTDTVSKGSLNTDAVLVTGFNSSVASFHQWLSGFVPGLSAEEISDVESLYPAEGSTETIDSYNTSYVRAGLVYRDVVLACPAYWIASAATEKGYLGEYTISPATHGSDTIYWNRINAVQQTNPVVYEGYAGAFASFFQTGDPNAHKVTNASQLGVPELHTGEEFVVVDDGAENVKLVQLKTRCDFWRRLARKIPV